MTPALTTPRYSAIEILPGLWLGDKNDAHSYFFLKEKKIQVIINCTDKVEFIPGELHIEKKRLAISDNPTYHDNKKMYKNLDHIVHYLYQSLNQNINILVHCDDGSQRGPTIIAAYFIRYAKVSADQAIRYVRTKYPRAFRYNVDYGYALEQFYKDIKKRHSD